MALPVVCNVQCSTKLETYRATGQLEEYSPKHQAGQSVCRELNGHQRVVKTINNKIIIIIIPSIDHAGIRLN